MNTDEALDEIFLDYDSHDEDFDEIELSDVDDEHDEAMDTQDTLYDDNGGKLTRKLPYARSSIS